MAELKLVQHINKLSGWDSEGEHTVFCRARHKLHPIDVDSCDACPYFISMGMDDAVICGWEDIPAQGGYPVKIVEHQNATDEFYRVSSMIDKGILKRG